MINKKVKNIKNASKKPIVFHFLKDHNGDNTNIRYQILAEGSGRKLRTGRNLTKAEFNAGKRGDKVEVEYTLKDFDTGKVIQKQQYMFELGHKMYLDPSKKKNLINSPKSIMGWELLLPKLRKGSKVRVFIPSKYAYGIGGKPNGGIKGNQILEFILRVKNIYLPS